MDAINKLSKKYNLEVIEDAAHAAGSAYKGKNIGDSIVIQFPNGTNLIEIIEIEHFKSDKLIQDRFLNNLIKIGSIKG